MSKKINTTVKFKNGIEMPIFGLGVYASKPGDEVYNAVRWALDSDYRLVDTASFYNNETDVGRAFKDSGLSREKYFITTKIWVTDLNKPIEALNASLKRLNSDYIDLYLLHWPGTDRILMLKAWEALIQAQESGKVKAIGVSNFKVHHLQDIISATGIIPDNNQIELHPWHQQCDIREFCKKNNITITAWGPIFHGHLSEEPIMTKIGEKYNKTAAQTTLRWHLQHDINIIPKSVKKERIKENADIFDIELSNEDMCLIDSLDGKKSFAFDSDVFNGL